MVVVVLVVVAVAVASAAVHMGMWNMGHGHQQPCDRDCFHNLVTLTLWPLGQCMPSNCYRVYVYQVWCW